MSAIFPFVTALIAVASASPVQPLAQRQASLTGAIAGAESSVKYYGDQSTIILDKASQPQWSTTYANGTTPWSQSDADVVNCLTNLHYTQKDVCISVSGSSCEGNYLKNGGRIQNSRVWNGQGMSFYTAKPFQLSGSDSSTIQAANNDLVGKSLNTDKEGNLEYGPHFNVWQWASDTDVSTNVGMWVSFIGEQGC